MKKNNEPTKEQLKIAEKYSKIANDIEPLSPEGEMMALNVMLKLQDEHESIFADYPDPKLRKRVENYLLKLVTFTNVRTQRILNAYYESQVQAAQLAKIPVDKRTSMN